MCAYAALMLPIFKRSFNGVSAVDFFAEQRLQKYNWKLIQLLTSVDFCSNAY